MAVDVIQSKRDKEDPLDKVVKLSSIGIGVAGLMGKGGGAKPESDTSAMTRRLDELKAGNSSAMENSKFADEDYKMSAAPKKKGFGLGIKY